MSKNSNIYENNKKIKIHQRKICGKRFTGSELEYKVLLDDESFIWQSRSSLMEQKRKEVKKFEFKYFEGKVRKLKKRIIKNKLQNKKVELETHSDSHVEVLKKEITFSIEKESYPNFFSVSENQNFQKCDLIPKMKTGLAYDIECMFHFGDPDEPESPERYRVCLQELTRSGLKNLCFPIFQKNLAKESISLVHSQNLMDELFEQNFNDCFEKNIVKSNKEESYYENPFTLSAVKAAVSQGTELANMVFEGKLNNGFCLVRPPGHHCDFDRKYGFCHANNICIAAKSILKKHPGSKLLIFDWDLHHGNGTEDIFYDEANLVYISVHQEYADFNGELMFPGTGSISDLGGRSARGKNINIPLPIGCGDCEFKSIFDYLVSPIIKEFSPDMIFISAGFDSAEGDPLGLLEVSPKMFGYMSSRFVKEQKNGKVAIFLEGGYNPGVVAECVSKSLKALLQGDSDYKPKNSREPDFLRYLNRIIRTQRVYWKMLYSSNPLHSANNLSADFPQRHKSRFIALKRYRELGDFEIPSTSDEEDENEMSFSPTKQSNKKKGKKRPFVRRFRKNELPPLFIDLTGEDYEKERKNELENGTFSKLNGLKKHLKYIKIPQILENKKPNGTEFRDMKDDIIVID